MEKQIKSSIQRVLDALNERGIETQIQEFGESTRTALEAANALSIGVGQIVKSLIVIGNNEPFLALVSGVNRLDMNKISSALQRDVRMANAQEVREVTGYAIGGVPPFGHNQQLITFLDQDLMLHEMVYAAAGTPFSVFGISPEKLKEATHAEIIDLKA